MIDSITTISNVFGILLVRTLKHKISQLRAEDFGRRFVIWAIGCIILGRIELLARRHEEMKHIWLEGDRSKWGEGKGKRER